MCTYVLSNALMECIEFKGVFVWGLCGTYGCLAVGEEDVVVVVGGRKRGENGEFSIGCGVDEATVQVGDGGYYDGAVAELLDGTKKLVLIWIKLKEIEMWEL